MAVIIDLIICGLIAGADCTRSRAKASGARP